MILPPFYTHDGRSPFGRLHLRQGPHFPVALVKGWNDECHPHALLDQVCRRPTCGRGMRWIRHQADQMGAAPDARAVGRDASFGVEKWLLQVDRRSGAIAQPLSIERTLRQLHEHGMQAGSLQERSAQPDLRWAGLFNRVGEHVSRGAINAAWPDKSLHEGRRLGVGPLLGLFPAQRPGKLLAVLGQG